MQKVTLEQQIEQKSHAQRTAMLEKAGRPGMFQKSHGLAWRF
jgi:hypothetical protein